MNREEKYVYLQSKTICHGGKHQQEKQPDTCITDGQGAGEIRHQDTQGNADGRICGGGFPCKGGEKNDQQDHLKPLQYDLKRDPGDEDRQQ